MVNAYISLVINICHKRHGRGGNEIRSFIESTNEQDVTLLIAAVIILKHPHNMLMAKQKMVNIALASDRVNSSTMLRMAASASEAFEKLNIITLHILATGSSNFNDIPREVTIKFLESTYDYYTTFQSHIYQEKERLTQRIKDAIMNIHDAMIPVEDAPTLNEARRLTYRLRQKLAEFINKKEMNAFNKILIEKIKTAASALSASLDSMDDAENISKTTRMIDRLHQKLLKMTK